VRQNFYGATVNGTPVAALPARCQKFIDLGGGVTKDSLRAAAA
jgi:hypothetical protein